MLATANILDCADIVLPISRSLVRLCSPGSDLQSRRRALLQHLAPEAEERRGPAALLLRGVAGRLDQGAVFAQPAEVLLMQVAARDRFDGPLQFGQRELRRHQLEDDRAVFELGAEPRDGGREDAAMVEADSNPRRR